MATTQKQLELLRQGSKGNDVSAIQQALKGYGFYGGVVDGLYGPKTAQAVKDFQNMTGIKVDAIVGPQTRSKLDEWANNPGLAVKSDPLIQQIAKNDPIVAKTLNAGGNVLDTLGAAYELGKKKLFPSMQGTQQDINNFYEIANQYLSPEWNQRLQFYRSDFESRLNKERADYEDNLKNAQDKIFNDKLSLDLNQAQTNNIDSSLGATQRNMFRDSSNRMLSGLERDTKYSLSNMARQFERDFGTKDVKDFNTGISRTGRVSDIGKYIPQSGTRSAYNPMGNQSGLLRNEYSRQVGQLGNQQFAASKNLQ